MSAPGFRHGFEDSDGKSLSRSVSSMGLPVVGCSGLPLRGSRVEVWRAGKSVPGRPSLCGVDMRWIFACGVSSLLMPGVGVGEGLILPLSFTCEAG